MFNYNIKLTSYYQAVYIKDLLSKDAKENRECAESLRKEDADGFENAIKNCEYIAGLLENVCKQIDDELQRERKEMGL